jgi:hypothetical protein
MGIFSFIGNQMKKHQENSAKGKVLDIIRTPRPDLAQYYFSGKYKTDVVHGGQNSYVVVWNGSPSSKDKEIMKKKLEDLM